MGGIEDLIDSRITAGDNRKTLNRVSGAKLASEKAEEAKERAEESIEEAAGKLGYINFDELWADGKLSGTLDGELPGVFIRNIAAEEILAGDIDAEYLNVRGRINIGPVTLNPSGITLPAVGESEDPADNASRKIKPFGGWASMEFGSGGTRGPALKASGTLSPNVEGVVRLVAKTHAGGSEAANSTANVIIVSRQGGRGVMRLVGSTDLEVSGYTSVGAGINLEGWTTLSPLNGWVHSAGSPVQQRLTADKGHIELRGALAGGGSVGGAMFFLPVGRRPPTDRQYVVGAGGGWALINVQANGGVQIANSAVSSPGWIHLAGVTFEL